MGTASEDRKDRMGLAVGFITAGVGIITASVAGHYLGVAGVAGAVGVYLVVLGSTGAWFESRNKG